MNLSDFHNFIFKYTGFAFAKWFPNIIKHLLNALEKKIKLSFSLLDVLINRNKILFER